MEINITEAFGTEILTPYQVAKIVNGLLEGLGIEKVLPPQMFYTYAKKGYLNGIKESKRIKGTDAAKWFEGYVVKFVEVTEEV